MDLRGERGDPTWMNDESAGARMTYRGHGADRSVLLIVDNGALWHDAADSIALAGMRIADHVDWDSAAERMSRDAAHDVTLLEAQGVAAELLVSALAQIDPVVRIAGSQVIVALGADQVDIVAAHLLGDHVQLLCDPSVTDRIAALTLAAASDGSRRHDAANDTEGARLRHLNDEVARIAETLARLTRREADTAPPRRATGLIGDRKAAFGTSPDGTEIDPHAIRQALRARRLRDQFFDRGMFEDPAWDMLLDLFAAELEGAQVSVSSLCIAASVAPTTALRWIAKMTEAGLFERRADPFDRRRAFMALSPRARAGMRDYVVAAMRVGLDIA
jgi:DNA-binding MarR family transcriptional regulator